MKHKDFRRRSAVHASSPQATSEVPYEPNANATVAHRLMAAMHNGSDDGAANPQTSTSIQWDAYVRCGGDRAQQWALASLDDAGVLPLTLTGGLRQERVEVVHRVVPARRAHGRDGGAAARR